MRSVKDCLHAKQADGGGLMMRLTRLSSVRLQRRLLHLIFSKMTPPYFDQMMSDLMENIDLVPNMKYGRILIKSVGTP